MRNLTPLFVAGILAATAWNVQAQAVSWNSLQYTRSEKATVTPANQKVGPSAQFDFLSRHTSVPAVGIGNARILDVPVTTIEDSVGTEANSTFDISVYGFIKADASYDNSRTNPGNYVLYVDREASRRNDNEFNLTANQTRLGLQLRESSGSDIRASGRLEIDFYGNYADENKAKIQMRHAFFEVNWPEHQLQLLAGQTWDVVSPLNPSTVNYSVLWNAGNIGYRRPQIRLTKQVAVGTSGSLELQAAIARTVGHEVLGAGAPSETGEDNGYPTFQGRVGLNLPFLSDSPTSLGVSAHYATEECDTSATGSSMTFNSWSLNVDFVQPITKSIVVAAEAFRGANLKAYLGGIGQGIRAISIDGETHGFDNEISSRGGWVVVTASAAKRIDLSLGASVDDVKDGDLNQGDRTINRVVFGNVVYALTERAGIAIELSHWRTGYLDSTDADDWRAQTALTYKF
ncbi:MAG: hypothetical protein HKN13_00280 [Rhodothermales bacterium]|nr:hypothetical protein [Rhodothermales bacterium]